MFPISIKEGSFDYGPITIPYSAVSGAGIGERPDARGIHRTLLITYAMPGAAKPRLIRFGLKPGAPGTELATAFRTRVPDRWKGEMSYSAMRKALGFSNRRVFGIVAALVVATVVGVLLLIPKHAPPAARVPVTAGGASATHP